MAPFARRGDFWSGLALAALGAYIVVQARAWTYMGEDGPGPGFFPVWYGAVMVVLSLALVVGAVRRPAVAAERFEWGELGRALACWAAFVACIALMRLTGFAAAFALLTWFIVAVMARGPQRVAIPVAIGGAALFQLVFAWALDVELPKGLFF